MLRRSPIIVLVALPIIGSCATSTRTVRPEDVASWRGAKLIELETHPLFSTIPRRVQRLSDGSEMWDFANCKTQTDDVRCTSGRGWAPGSIQTKCSGGESNTSCCHNQFFVRDGVVEAFRPTGSCYTDCSVRPGGTC